MVTGGGDGTIKLWAGRASSLLRTIRGHTEAVSSVEFVANAKSIISTSEHVATAQPGDNTTRLWSVASGKQLLLFGEFDESEFDEPSSVDAKDVEVAYSVSGTIVSWTNREFQEKRDAQINIWSGETGEHLRSITVPPFRSLQVSLSDDGTILLVSDLGAEGFLPGHRGKTNLINTETGQLIKALDGYSVLSPDGSVLYNFALNDEAASLINARSGELIARIYNRNAAVFSPDGKVLVVKTNGGELSFYDGRIGALLHRTKGTFERTVFSHDSQYLLVKQTSSIDIWKIAGWEKKVSWNNIESSVIFSAAGDLVIFIQSEKTTRKEEKEHVGLWKAVIEVVDLATGKTIRQFREWLMMSGLVQLSKDAKTVILMTDTGLRRKQIHGSGDVLIGNPIRVARPTFSLDGNYFALEMGEKLKIWDASGGDLIRSVELKNEEGSVRYRGKDLPHYPWLASDDSGILLSVFFPNLERALDLENSFFGFRPTSVVRVSEKAPSGRNGFPSRLSLYDVATNRFIRSLKVEFEPGKSFMASPDGRIISERGGSNRFGYGALLDARDGNSLGEDFVFEGPAGLAAAFSPKSTYFVYDSGSGVIGVIDLNDPKTHRKLAGHDNASLIRSFAFTQDEQVMASSASDNTTRLWSVTTGKMLATVVAFEDGNWLVVTPNGLFDGSPTAWSRFLWRFSEKTFDVLSPEAFFSEFFRPGLLAELLSTRKVPDGKSIATLDRHQPFVKIAARYDVSTDVIKKGALVSSRTIRVEVTVSQPTKGSGAQDVRLFRNGSLVKAWTGDVLSDPRKVGCEPIAESQVVCATNIQVVAGENRFTAYAFNRDNIKSSDGELSVIGVPGVHRRGRFYALTVGINAYENSKYNLKYAVADAVDFGATIAERQKLIGIYGAQVVIQLADRDATRTNILYALERFAKGDQANPPVGISSQLMRHLSAIQKTEPEDALVVFFAGHGIASKDRFYLLPHDLGVSQEVTYVDEEKLQRLRAHGISDTDLEVALSGLDVGQLLIVIDACNSGQVLESDEKRRGPMNSKGLAQMAYEKGMNILTASQSFQTAREPSALKHGLLTYALLKGLGVGAAADSDLNGEVWDREWMNFAAAEVPRLEKRLRCKRVMLKDGPESKRTAGTQNESEKWLQTPRVFYRRETNPKPLVMAKLDAGSGRSVRRRR